VGFRYGKNDGGRHKPGKGATRQQPRKRGKKEEERIGKLLLNRVKRGKGGRGLSGTNCRKRKQREDEKVSENPKDEM